MPNLVTSDTARDALHAGLTPEERVRLGRKLRALRVERGLKQAEVAPTKLGGPNKVGITLGTLQAIESNWHDVAPGNIEKLATFYGTTIAALLAEDPVPGLYSPALLKDLHDEHLEIAHAYRNARRRVRAAIERLLLPDGDQLAETVLKLPALRRETLVRLDALLAASPDEDLFALAVRILRCADSQRQAVADLVGQFERNATPTRRTDHAAAHPSASSTAAPTRRGSTAP